MTLRASSFPVPTRSTTTHGYDLAGNLTSTTDPLNHTTGYGYDADGRLGQVTDPLNRFVIYNFDADGRIKSTRLYSGITPTYTYDANGRLSASFDGLGNKTTYTYDADGRQASATDPRGNSTSYAYDPAGRLTSITDPLNGRVSFGYDLAGQKTSVTNPRGDVMSFTYDALGDVATQTDPAKNTTTFLYDLGGRLTSKTDPRGVTINNTYDAANRLTGVVFPGGSISLVYDALNRRTTMTDPTGTTNYSYDAASRLMSVGTAQGTVSYGYDAAGNRTSMSIPLRGTMKYAYDAANQQSTLTDWANHVFSFTYAPDGMPASISRPGNVVTTFGYDGADRLTSIHHDQPSGAIAHYDYTLDPNGNRTSMTSASGTENYSLDALNRLTNVYYPNGDSASYTYDAAGNRLTSTVNGATTNYTYDTAGRLVSQGGKVIAYDGGGNTVSIGSDTYTWDWAGRLASSTVGGITSTYGYDGDGIRVSTTTAGATTNYTWDRAASMPQLVDDGTQGYVQTAQGTLEQQGSTTTYPLTDALGSVRTVETPTPSVAASTSYDVFGLVRSQTGQQSIFGFTGQQTDSSGLSFLSARYYKPSLGRFLSPDSLQPNGPGTQGYDLYAYTSNNPTTVTDPSGHGEAEYALPRLIWAAAVVALEGLAALLVSYLDEFLLLVIAGLVGAESAALLSIALRKPWTPSIDLPKVPSKTLGAIGAAVAAAALAGLSWAICPATGQPEPAIRVFGVPVFCVYAHRTPFIFFNDASAIARGAPFSLHYEGSQAQRDANREAATGKLTSCTLLFSALWSLDEYPFASSKEGGKNSQVWCVPVWEQTNQSIDLNRFYRSEFNYQDNSNFYVLTVPY
jgi:RHS repeat-associated protein